jgi:hypothetical protein
MNSYIASQNIALSVVYLRDSRAHVPDKYDSRRLEGPLSLIAIGLRRMLLRPELISATLDEKTRINYRVRSICINKRVVSIKMGVAGATSSEKKQAGQMVISRLRVGAGSKCLILGSLPNNARIAI